MSTNKIGLVPCSTQRRLWTEVNSDLLRVYALWEKDYAHANLTLLSKRFTILWWVSFKTRYACILPIGAWQALICVKQREALLKLLLDVFSFASSHVIITGGQIHKKALAHIVDFSKNGYPPPSSGDHLWLYSVTPQPALLARLLIADIPQVFCLPVESHPGQCRVNLIFS